MVEACQKKKHCKFHGSPQFYGLGASGVGDSSGTSSYHSSTASSNAISNDPCPKRRKIVEVAYKCRPCKSAAAAQILFNLVGFIGRTIEHVKWLTNSVHYKHNGSTNWPEQSRLPESTHKCPTEWVEREPASSGRWLFDWFGSASCTSVLQKGPRPRAWPGAHSVDILPNKYC